MRERQLFPVFDAAYLGFNSGSFDEDAFAIREFVGEMNMEAAICISFAKNMGLYGERQCSEEKTNQASKADSGRMGASRLSSCRIQYSAGGCENPILAGNAPTI